MTREGLQDAGLSASYFKENSSIELSSFVVMMTFEYLIWMRPKIKLACNSHYQIDGVMYIDIDRNCTP